MINSKRIQMILQIAMKINLTIVTEEGNRTAMWWCG
jgi:hypothetical protein